ncbi:MAG: hypothetical protein EU530_08260 [Promethearchaeota archaeon]|nr:MAG: hypothetical protein EU530_08260 [Candidatus Lokiarchaeota archaeon]
MVNPDVLFPMIYEFSIYAGCLLMVIIIGQRYRERKKPVIKYMFYFSFFMSLAILLAAFSRVLRYTELWIIQIYPEVKLEFLAFTICFIAIGNIFMLAFCLEVFTKKGVKSTVGIAFLTVYSVLIAGFCVYSIWTGLFVVDLTEMIWGIAIVLSLFVYGWTMVAALALAFKLEKGPDRVGTLFISISPISIMMVFVMFFLDRMFGGNFTVFYYIGWVFVIISMFFMYLGVIRPKWVFKERKIEN